MSIEHETVVQQDSLQAAPSGVGADPLNAPGGRAGCLAPVRRRLLVLGLGTGLSGLLAACGDKPPEPVVARPAATTGAPPGLPAVSAADTLTLVRVGIDPAYPPFSSLDAHGQMVGFDVELIQALAGRAGWQVSLISTPWADLFDALGRGERDLLVSAITITEERRRRMLFSDPYFRAEQVVALRTGLTVRHLDELKRRRVSVQAGTLGDDTMRRLMGPQAAAMLQRHDTADKAISALTAGSADAVVCDSGPVLHHLMRHGAGRWALAPQLSFQPSLYGVAVNTMRPDLLQGLARAWVEVQASGVYDSLMTKYFGPAGLALARAPG